MNFFKNLMAALAARFGMKIVSLKHHKGPKPEMDPAFAPLYEACRPYTLIQVERMYSLYKAVEYIVKKNLPGDFVECGVYKGGASMMMALALQKFGAKDRMIYLYDTYEGMAKPTPEDMSVMKGAEPVMEIWEREQKGDHNEWCYGPLDGVKAAMESTGYPMDKVVFVKGMVEHTLPNDKHEKIALLRLDTDWYSSTKHELEHLFPKLQQGGVLILDDYGYWAGARQAADEYFASTGEAIFLHRDDYSGATGVRCS
jgi:predicted O-methyltransferase YrrM